MCMWWWIPHFCSVYACGWLCGINPRWVNECKSVSFLVLRQNAHSHTMNEYNSINRRLSDRRQSITRCSLVRCLCCRMLDFFWLNARAFELNSIFICFVNYCEIQLARILHWDYLYFVVVWAIAVRELFTVGAVRVVVLSDINIITNWIWNWNAFEIKNKIRFFVVLLAVGECCCRCVWTKSN